MNGGYVEYPLCQLAYVGAYADLEIRQWASENLKEYIMNNIYDADDSSIINPTTGEAQVKPGCTDLNQFDLVETIGYCGEFNIQMDDTGKDYDVFTSLNRLNEQGYIVNFGFERTIFILKCDSYMGQISPCGLVC